MLYLVDDLTRYKVDYTDDMDKRLKYSISTNKNAKILSTIPGLLDDIKPLKQALKDYRSSGIWFKHDPKVIEIFNNYKTITVDYDKLWEEYLFFLKRVFEKRDFEQFKPKDFSMNQILQVYKDNCYLNPKYKVTPNFTYILNYHNLILDKNFQKHSSNVYFIHPCISANYYTILKQLPINTDSIKDIINKKNKILDLLNTNDTESITKLLDIIEYNANYLLQWTNAENNAIETCEEVIDMLNKDILKIK